MGPVLVVVAHILGHQELQVALIEHNHMIQQLSPATSHPTLCNAVLPRTAKGGADGLASHSFRERQHVLVDFASQSNNRNLWAAV